MRKELSLGALIYQSKDPVNIVLVLDRHNNWGLPKGHPDDGETKEETLEREIKEETGIKDLRIGEEIGRINYKFKDKEGLIDKDVAFYLAETGEEKFSPEDTDEIKKVEWFSKEKALTTIKFDSLKEIINKGMAIIEK